MIYLDADNKIIVSSTGKLCNTCCEFADHCEHCTLTPRKLRITFDDYLDCGCKWTPGLSFRQQDVVDTINGSSFVLEQSDTNPCYYTLTQDGDYGDFKRYDFMDCIAGNYKDTWTFDRILITVTLGAGTATISARIQVTSEIGWYNNLINDFGGAVEYDDDGDDCGKITDKATGLVCATYHTIPNMLYGGTFTLERII